MPTLPYVVLLLFKRRTLYLWYRTKAWVKRGLLFAMAHRRIRLRRIVIFMKGSLEEPTCMYSRKLRQLLSPYDRDSMQTFDILTEGVNREFMKSFAEWPTYPMIFVNATFVGGIDVLESAFEEDYLDELLQAPMKHP